MGDQKGLAPLKPAGVDFMHNILQSLQSQVRRCAFRLCTRLLTTVANQGVTIQCAKFRSRLVLIVAPDSAIKVKLKRAIPYIIPDILKH